MTPAEHTLFCAMEEGSVSSAKRALTEGVSPNATNPQGQSALVFAIGLTRTAKDAARHMAFRFVRLLTQAGAYCQGTDVIEAALSARHPKIMTWLLQQGGHLPKAALFGLIGRSACAEVFWDVVLPHAQVNSQDNEGQTVLHHLARRGDAKRIAQLLSRGANPLLRNHAGQTPYQVCVPAVEQMLHRAQAHAMSRHMEKTTPHVSAPRQHERL